MYVFHGLRSARNERAALHPWLHSYAPIGVKKSLTALPSQVAQESFCTDESFCRLEPFMALYASEPNFARKRQGSSDRRQSFSNASSMLGGSPALSVTIFPRRNLFPGVEVKPARTK